MIDKKSSVPIYQQIRDSLLNQIKNGKLKPGCLIPSENQLSQRYSVNRLTVRQALSELEQDEILFTVSGKGRYVQTKGRVQLKREKLEFTLGVYPLNSDIAPTNFYTLGLLNGLISGFHSYNVSSEFFNSESLRYNHTGMSLFATLSQRRIDGLIWNSPGKEDLPIILEVAKRIPVVVVNQVFPGSAINYVATDGYIGSRKVTQHLLGLGHRRIGCISVVRSLFYAAERWRGYADAHYEANVALDKKLTVEVKNAFIDFAKELDYLWKNSRKVSAVFIAGGNMIPFILKYLKDKRMRIPEDISVVGFDEVSLSPELPEIMTVKQPLAEMAKIAVDILIKLLKKERSEPAEIVLEPEIIKRNSCAPPCGKFKV